MRKEAKITLTLFVALGGVVAWYVWPGGGESDDLVLDTADTHVDRSASTTDADGTRSGESMASPLRAEPITIADDAPSSNLTAALDGEVGKQATRPAKRGGRRRGGDRLSRVTPDDAGTRLDSILAALEPTTVMDEQADGAADPIGAADVSPSAKRTIPASTSSRARRSTIPSDAARSYTIGRGDTLAILAEVYYGSQAYASFLARANPQIEHPGNLTVGTKLSIPPLPVSLVSEAKRSGRSEKLAPSRPASQIEPGIYVVRNGDSLYRIAEQLLGEASRWPEIHAQNRAVIGDDPTNLKIGQRLRIPSTPKSD